MRGVGLFLHGTVLDMKDGVSVCRERN